ncbi:MAG TPA: SDR family oxidoreductase [Burkholderiaceae bacterium]|nr:SDR family oxidoreductase [Burkholderiaceae bacterium]
MQDLLGRTAVVTGAARGIGHAIADAFRDAGATVYVLDIQEPTAEQAEQAGREPQAPRWLSCDVRSESSVAAAAARIAEMTARVDILVNNAAAPIGSRSKLVDCSLDDWTETMAVNLTSVFLVSKHFIPLMRKEGGSIINMSSIWAHVGRPGTAAYTASKGGILAMTRLLAIEHAQDKIRVNSLSPGTIGTERLAERYGTLDEVSRQMAHLHPLGRIGTADEVAQAALFLASPAASFVTGTDIKVDGGYCTL